MSQPTNPIQSVLQWSLAPARHRKGVVLFRILVGLTLLYQLGILYGQRSLLFGTDAIPDYQVFASQFGSSHFSLLAFHTDPLWLDFIYHGTLIVIGLWAAGYATRLTTPLVWLGVHSIHNRFGELWDGGDNLIHIVMIYAVLMELGPRSQPEQSEGQTSSAELERPVRLRDVLHNLGLGACILQVCTVYFVAGLTKVGGKYWANGTAFYYVLNSTEYGFAPFGSLIWNSPILLTVMTWSPLVLQLAFPFVYLFGRPAVRRSMVLIAISFHVGIFVTMGLETFASFMIAAELLLLSDADFKALEDRLRAISRGVAKLLGRQKPSADAVEAR